MKKTILAMAMCTFITSAIITSCNNSSEKVENSQNKVQDAKKDLDNANQEYLKDVENFRKETGEKIVANDKSIAELKSKVEHVKKEAKADYNKKIAALEQKNNDMKKKLDEYKVEGKEKWEIFKIEFNSGMDELSSAFEDLTVKKVK